MRNEIQEYERSGLKSYAHRSRSDGLVGPTYMKLNIKKKVIMKIISVYASTAAAEVKEKEKSY